MADELVQFTCTACGCRTYRVDEIGQYFCAECHRFASDVPVSPRPDPVHPMLEKFQRFIEKYERARITGRIR